MALLVAVLAGWLTPALAAGPYPGGPDSGDTDAIPAASPLFKAWATGVSGFTPGPRRIGAVTSVVTYGSAPSVLGSPDAAGATYPVAGPNPIPAAPVLSLGDGGSVVLTFANPIADGAGPDFAVFENGFLPTATSLFAELAFVEVSSNGTDFIRFPAVSCTQFLTQIGNGGSLDPRDLHNLAGKHPAGYGTPFDLAELPVSLALDITRITHVRIVDVVGDVLTGYGSRDSLGNLINDPWPTNFQTCGFDLDAVGVIHQAADIWQQYLANPDADPDHDGRTNLVEWAVDSQPNVPDATLPLHIKVSEHTTTLSFQRADRTGLALTVEESENGTDWNGLAVPSDPGFIIVNVPRTPGRAFYRLCIIRTP